MKHLVQVREVLSKYILVETNDYNEAVSKAQAMHEQGKISLDYDDYDEVEVCYVKKADEFDVKIFEKLEED